MTNPFNTNPYASNNPNNVINAPQGGAVFPDDPFGNIKQEQSRTGYDPRAVGLIHAASDVDSSPLSQHHTLGVKHNQAAAGDHVHDGLGGSRKVGSGLTLTVTGSRGGNAALASLITALAQVINLTDSTTP